MNAPVTLAPAVRPADLRDACESARIAAFVREAPGGTPFHLPAWLTAIERGTRQRAHCLIAERGGALTGILPLTEMHSMLFGKALVSSGFAVGGGILASDDESRDALAEAGWALAARLGIPGVELRGGVAPDVWARHDGVYSNFARDLAADPEAELLAVPRKQRAEIRKALANDLTIDTGTGARDRDAHYAVYAESVRNLGTPVFPRKLFDAMLDGFGEDADILTIRHDGAAVASVLSLYFNGTVMPYWGGGTQRARALRANDLLYYALMNHARERGCTRFDFGRSKDGTGAWSFKKNWGFEAEPLVYFSRVSGNQSSREVNPNSPKYRLFVNMWQHLPLFAANRLGPLLSRGLG